MDFLIKKETGSMSKIDNCETATHVIMNIDEFNSYEQQVDSMRRIIKERSNADRKIIPKKDRSGYILLGYGNENLTFKLDKPRHISMRRMIFETPYDYKFSYITVQQLINDDSEKLFKLLYADGYVFIDYIHSNEIANSILSAESKKIVIIGLPELNRNLQWSVKMYFNFTPEINDDFIKNDE